MWRGWRLYSQLLRGSRYYSYLGLPGSVVTVVERCATASLDSGNTTLPSAFKLQGSELRPLTRCQPCCSLLGQFRLILPLLLIN